MHVAAVIRAKSHTSTVGVLLPTSGAFPIAALACWMLGKTLVPLNYLLKREELDYVVQNCEADLVVTTQPLLDFMGYVPTGVTVVKMEDMDFSGFPEAIVPATAQDEDLAVLLYTSGTSGKPKGVMLTHGNISANISQVMAAINVKTTDVMLGVLPQFHSFGLTVLTLVPLTVGMKVVYTAKFVPSKLIKLAAEHNASIFIAIASMWAALLSAKDAGPSELKSLRLAVSGGEPLPDATADRIRERFGVLINEGYGLTETSPATNFCQPHQYKRHSVGPAIPWMVQRIVDINTGNVLGPGEEGEIQMRGPNVTQGYFKLPHDTGAAFTPDGYFRTGDIGKQDEDGFLYITGRLKEMLIVGGENVFPREIEEVINLHPAVVASGVIGAPDALRGELPLAFIEVTEGQGDSPTLAKEIMQWCRERLANYKVPKEIRIVAALPRNATGKIVRRDLKKLLT
jgi:long-chain acyl-CoA synthetase